MRQLLLAALAVGVLQGCARIDQSVTLEMPREDAAALHLPLVQSPVRIRAEDLPGSGLPVEQTVPVR